MATDVSFEEKMSNSDIEEIESDETVGRTREGERERTGSIDLLLTSLSN